MPVKMTLNKGRHPVKVYTEDINQPAIDQLINVANLPFIHSHVAAMPDVHLGIGATVGSVIPLRGAIVPAAVGVDIGCGMNAVRLSLKARDLPDNLRGLRSAIERDIPVGFNLHRKTDPVPDSTIRALAPGLDTLQRKHPGIRLAPKKGYATWIRQLATLGGGNHFIELCLDEDDAVWVMLHSGSRGIGNVIGRYFISKAREEMERLDVHLPQKDLAYFTEDTESFDDYVFAVNWAQEYARINRREMMRKILQGLRFKLPDFTVTKDAINCHHNYVSYETHFGADVYVTRKGAIRARHDELGIIPGSMGARSYIVRGKGSKQSFESCAHGAGRAMSRSQARKHFSKSDLETQTVGVECRKDRGVLDEIPGAYKDIDTVMENQNDLVEVVHTLKQVVCVKG